jgi:hypothetical protein
VPTNDSLAVILKGGLLNMSSFNKLMWKQFKKVGQEYLALREERANRCAEIIRAVERLGLLQKLLALDGQKVDIPSDIRSFRCRPVRRKAA